MNIKTAVIGVLRLYYASLLKPKYFKNIMLKYFSNGSIVASLSTQPNL